jgi:hypothetical protein
MFYLSVNVRLLSLCHITSHYHCLVIALLCLSPIAQQRYKFISYPDFDWATAKTVS